MPQSIMHNAQHVKSGFSTVTVDTNSTEIVSPSPDRVLLIICPPSTGTLTISIGTSVVAGEGMNLQVSDSPMVITAEQMKDLSFRGWKGIMDAGSATIGVFEGIYYPHDDGYD